MNTCDTCKWWDSEDTSGVIARRERHWNSPETWKDRACQCQEFEEETQFGIEGPCYYGETITTGPKFGCIHYEEKNG